jgi:membrane protease YdiL (CAAX protease family)
MQQQPWGFLATCAWFGFALVALIVLPKLFPALWDDLGRWSRGGTASFFASQLGYGAVHLVVFVGPLLLAARLAGWSVGTYFALSRPRLRDFAICGIVPILLLTLKTVMLWRTTSVGTGLDSWSGAMPALLATWALIFPVVFAPLWEEPAFRGFLFRGLAQSRLGPVGAIALTSVAFTAAHPLLNGPMPIDALVIIFLVGLYLGWVRHRTGSIVPTILFHAMFNVPAQLAATALILGRVL